VTDVEIISYLKKILGRLPRTEFSSVDRPLDVIIELLRSSRIGLASRIANFRDLAINPLEYKTLLDLSGAGVVDQVLIRSPSRDIRIVIEVDGSEILNNTYDELRQIEQDARDISAFEELDEDGNPTGYYVVSIKDIGFLSSIKISVQNIGVTAMSIPNAFVKYRLGGGVGG